MAVPPIVALKAAGTAQKAATGDIYARRWTEVRGKGKKQRVIEHEAHFNPLVAIIGLGAAATAGVAALWLAQLKLTPVRHQAYTTVVDKEAWTEEIPIGGAGHWEQNTTEDTSVPPVRMWQAGTNIKGTYKPGYWYDYYPDTPAPGEHWVQDINESVQTISHAAETHQEPAGKSKLRFTIEQRQPFTISDLLPNPVSAFKESQQALADTLVPPYLKWAAPWTWGTKGKWFK